MQQLRITYAAGVVPGKWIDRFAQRYPQVELSARRHDAGPILEELSAGRADVVFVRYAPGQSPKDETRHVIPLYQELEVVCAAREHDVEYYDQSIPAAEVEKFALLDLADYPPERGGVEMALEVVASGAFVARMPMSLARLHARKDVIHRVIEDGQPTQIGISWPVDAANLEIVEEFIGVVRGRSATSSRQASVRQKQQHQARTEPKAGRKPAAGGKPSPGRHPKPRKRR
ncbi:LysR family transcriptional regulator substrate-binding protein [Glutamicibacter creatinolyticus]|uniref:LysR family transcriptional regulator substrate-binding protein n=1 Tax=Glutamicibacter creatinolyticus TaxID=162496 RepID=UPI0031E393AD